MHAWVDAADAAAATPLLAVDKENLDAVCALLGLHIGRFRDRIACPTASLTTFEFGSRGPLLVRIGEALP